MTTRDPIPRSRIRTTDLRPFARSVVLLLLHIDVRFGGHMCFACVTCPLACLPPTGTKSRMCLSVGKPFYLLFHDAAFEMSISAPKFQILNPISSTPSSPFTAPGLILQLQFRALGAHWVIFFCEFRHLIVSPLFFWTKQSTLFAPFIASHIPPLGSWLP